MGILIGSRAIKEYFPEFREPKDWDFFSPVKETGSESFWDDRLLQWPWGTIATVNELYTIKVSHSFWDINWQKHTWDMAFLKRNGAEFIPELYKILYPIWEDKHGKKSANLNVKAEDFFNKQVERVFDHDSIHRSIAYYDRPLYERILRDGQEVAVDRNKFEALSYEDKLKLVREEVYATAIERQVIPSGYGCSPRGAYAWALKKTVTSFSKGFFPLFISLNFEELRAPDVNYVKKHLDNKDRLIKL